MAKKRESEKLRHARIRENPELLKAENEKRRKRYDHMLQAEKLKLKTAREKSVESRRRKWRLDKQIQIERMKEAVQKASETSQVAVPLKRINLWSCNPAAAGTSHYSGSSSFTTQDSRRSQSARTELKRRVECKRAKQKLLMKKQEYELERMAKRLRKYKMRYYRLRYKNQSTSNSPRSKLDCELRESGETILPTIRKKLLFGAAVTTDIGDLLNKVQNRRTSWLTRLI